MLCRSFTLESGVTDNRPLWEPCTVAGPANCLHMKGAPAQPTSEKLSPAGGRGAVDKEEEDRIRMRKFKLIDARQKWSNWVQGEEVQPLTLQASQLHCLVIRCLVGLNFFLRNACKSLPHSSPAEKTSMNFLVPSSQKYYKNINNWGKKNVFLNVLILL